MKRHISYADKSRLVQKVLDQPSRSIKEIAIEASVGYSSLQKWVRQYKAGKLTSSHAISKSAGLSYPDKLELVLNCQNKPDEYRNSYCRTKGLYPEQLIQWKADILSYDPKQAVAKERAENKNLRAENKALQRELRRKEKALAEASALLILKKKADRLFGLDDEDS